MNVFPLPNGTCVKKRIEIQEVIERGRMALRIRPGIRAWREK